MKFLKILKTHALSLTLCAMIGCLLAAPLVQGNVGPYPGAAGTNNVVGSRIDKTGSAVVSQSNGKYYQANESGILYGATYSAGAAPGTTISTTAAASLYNPVASGVNLIVCKVSCGYVSGTVGTGTMFHCVNMTPSQGATSGGSLVTGQPLSGTGTAAGVFRAGGTVVAPTAYRPFVTLAPMLASSVLALTPWVEDMDGEVLVPPGCSYQLQSIAAAGTSPLLALGLVWMEIPAR